MNKNTNRRRFITSCGAATLLSTVSGANTRTEPQGEVSKNGRSRIDLNGNWERHINGEPFDIIAVPSSQSPVGIYQLKKTFILPRLPRTERAFLCFAGITYFGRVFVNGAELGTMGPYVPYEFEFTEIAKEGTNHVEVVIADACAEPGGAGKDEIALGVNAGWEAYGGIIRDVHVELRTATFIENVRFEYVLDKSFTQASCRAKVYASSQAPGSGQVEVALFFGEAEVKRAQKQVDLPRGSGEIEVAFDLPAPALWSPEEPNLYGLKTILRNGEAVDRYDCRTGFRDVKIRGNQFELNGQALVLNGVCRHDMWKDQGFTLTRAQQLQDMRMIKGLGCNFVRLVHYPHDRHIVELADELGMLVSEEPGFWGMDFKTMSRPIVKLGLGIMERMIRRDWNSPSVFAWLLGNECELTVEYLREGKALCRKLDPLARPVSFANSQPKEEVKPIFEAAEMDFFDQHPYTYDVDEFIRQAEYFGPSRPLTFTEWGGRAIGQTQFIMPHTLNRLIELTDSKQLAGHSFWSWQDMRQYTRIDSEMQDGILKSGVVTEDREPRPFVYTELARLFQRHPHEELPVDERPRKLPLRQANWATKGRFDPIDLHEFVAGPQGSNSWEAFESRLAEYYEKARDAREVRNQWRLTGKKFLLWREPEVEILGARFVMPRVNGYVRPLVLLPEVPELNIPVGKKCARLHFLGQISVPTGFPLEGEDGKTVARYTIRYSGGTEEQVAVRQGREVARGNLIHLGTRLEPVATEAEPALLFVKDWRREQYQILLFSIPTEGKEITSLSLKLIGEQQPLLIFAITAEIA
ncbi:MAG: glycoside hydrolase family 2 TIM barrel-domain containing protein [Terriglobia bacterium]